MKTGEQTSQGATRSAGGRSEIAGEAGARFPLIGSAKLGAKAGLEMSAGRSSGQTRSSEITRTLKEPVLEIMRPMGRFFELRLNAGLGGDLVQLNPDLNRVSVLFAPEPGSLDPKSVTVLLSTTIKSGADDVTHSIRVRDAGGRWAKLIENQNKKVVSELLMSKFLKPMYKQRKIWPQKDRAGG